jgi:hypothetical protein
MKSIGPRRASRGARLAPLGIALAALLAPPSGATLLYSDVYLEARAACTDCEDGSGDLYEQLDLFVPDGSATELEVLLEPDYDRFPGSQSALPEGFLSAAMSGRGLGGVGVSGVVHVGGSAEASASYRQTITNTGPDFAPLSASFAIPEIALLTSHSEGGVSRPAQGPWYAFADWAFHWIQRDAGGAVLREFTPLNLFARVDRTNLFSAASSIELELSNQLEAFVGIDPTLLHEIVDTSSFRDVLGYRIDPIAGPLAAPRVPPGGSVEIELLLRVGFSINSIDGDDRTAGFEVRIGDPFDVSGGGGASFAVREAPEPSGPVLLATGALLLLAWRGAAQLIARDVEREERLRAEPRP